MKQGLNLVQNRVLRNLAWITVGSTKYKSKVFVFESGLQL